MEILAILVFLSYISVSTRTLASLYPFSLYLSTTPTKSSLKSSLMNFDLFKTLKIFFFLVFFIAFNNVLDLIFSFPINEISSNLTLLPLLISKNILTFDLVVLSFTVSVLIVTLAFKKPFFL